MERIRLAHRGICLFALLGAGAARPLAAATNYWTGAAGDGLWWNAQNWSGESFAGWGDTVVFTNDAPLTLSRAGCPNGVVAGANRIYRFQGADVTFQRDGGSLSVWGGPDVVPRPEIFVVAGTTVTFSNSVGMYNNGPLVKTGGGTVRQVGAYPDSSFLMSESVPSFLVAEGLWEMESPGAGVYCMVTNVIVEAGATFRLKGYNALNEKALWRVDGTLQLDTRGGADAISTLVGRGRVEVATEGLAYRQDLKILNGKRGPSSFAGTFGAGVNVILTNKAEVAAEDFTFTVAAPNVFAEIDLDDRVCDLSALRFASGIGTFNFCNLSLNTTRTLKATDADGRGVEIRLNALTQATATTDPVTLTLMDGRFCGAPSAPTQDARDANRTLPQTGFFRLLPENNAAYRRNLVVSGGEAHFQNNGAQIAELAVVSGGVAHVGDGYLASAAAPSVIRLDGGTLLMATRDTPYNYNLPAAAAKEHVSLVVGAAGAKIGLDDTRAADSLRSFLNVPVEPVAGVADGGLEILSAYGSVNVNAPVRLSGGLRMTDGRLILMSSEALRATPQFLGMGDVTLSSTLLLFNDFSESTTLAIPGAFTYDASVTVHYRSHAAKAAQAVTCGALARAGKGAVLFLYDPATVGDGDSSFRVTSAPATHANGVLRQPVVLDDAGLALKFAAYDAERGVVPFAGGKAGAAAGADDILALTESYTLPADTTKSVLGVAGKPWATLSIPATSTLKVGNGTDPALVLLNTSQVGGAGTLDFGTSEGVIAANYHPYNNAVNCRIAGSGGVTFAASAKFRNMTVAGDSTYSGGTRVTAVDLWVRSATAFGTGDVHVLGGPRNGGKLLFDRPLTLANDFHVSGWGHPFNEWNVASNGYGAVVFKANGVELAGAVEIVGAARLSAEKAEDVGRLTGVVSGGFLSVYKGAGVVALLNDNTYTGGTEVVCATVVVAKGGGLGTGAVTLDRGVLRFVNTEAITFTNTVTGVGHIELAGAAPVTFVGASFAALPFKTLAAGTALDVAAPAESVIVPFVDGETNLGGGSYTVGGVTGTGLIRNGTLTVTGEISPAGAGRIGTLAFGPGVLVARGATYVCDVADGTADRLVVSGDFDLSALAFRAVRNGSAHGASPTVLETADGTLANEFASVMLGRRAWQVSYGETAVRLDLNAGLLFILK